MVDDEKVEKPVIDMQQEVTAGSPTNEQETVASEEEREWSSLKGTTQDRVRQVIKERNDYKEKFGKLEEKLKELETKVTAPNVPPPPPVADGKLTPEQQAAIDTLRKFGIATKEDLQALKDQQIIEDTYTRLESKYTGEDGKPVFNREAIEKHMRATGIYNPEKAYEDMYREELFDLRMKEQSSSSPSYTVKPTGMTGNRSGEPLSVDTLRERLAKPDGKAWWEKNRTKILPVLGELMK